MWNKFSMWQRKRLILKANGIYHEQWIVFLIVILCFSFLNSIGYCYSLFILFLSFFFFFSEYCFICEFFPHWLLFSFFFVCFPLNTLKIGACFLNTFICAFLFLWILLLVILFHSFFILLLSSFFCLFWNISCVIQLVVFSPLLFPSVDWALENN